MKRSATLLYGTERMLITALMACALYGLSSCSDLFRTPDEPGVLLISLESSSAPVGPSVPAAASIGLSSVTGASSAGLLSATTTGWMSAEDFTISVTGPDGVEVYRGPYSACPEQLEVPSGSYTISAFSCDFPEPAYDCPQFGDTRVVVVKSGQSVAVSLVCRQLNCGIHLNVDTSFSAAFPYGYLYLQGADGALMYDYCEKRTAFFEPGSISLLLSDNGESQTLFTRTLSAQQMLSVNVSAAVDGTSTGISLQIDTSRVWLTEDFCLGGGGDGLEDAFSVPEARDHIGATDVWVYGYIVGCCTSSTGFCQEAPFTKNTNIVIAARSSVSDKASCLSVELPSGAIRDALNLVDNPSNLGRPVYLRGDLVSAYFGIPGLKSPTEYQWK